MKAIILCFWLGKPSPAVYSLGYEKILNSYLDIALDTVITNKLPVKCATTYFDTVVVAATPNTLLSTPAVTQISSVFSVLIILI
jgi:hypothetical protein